MTLQQEAETLIQETREDIVGLWQLHRAATELASDTPIADQALEIASLLLDDPLIVVGVWSWDHQAYLVWQGDKNELLQRIREELVPYDNSLMPLGGCRFICPTINQVPCKPE